MSSATTPARVLSRLGVASLAAAALLASGAISGASATPTQVEVTVDDIATSRPAGDGWFVDNAGSGGSTGGTFAVTKDGPGNDLAMKLGVTTSSDLVYLYNAFAPGTGPRDIPALLAGASYDYAGVNVNFQLQLVFTPADAAYGPSGATPCTSAVAWGLSSDPAACYTVIKWEPYAQPGTAAWTHVDLSADTAAQSSTSTGGWVSSKRLGQYAGNVSNGQLMSVYLGQMADYEVTAFAFGIGSGTPGPANGYVKSYTIGGTTYGFASTPAPPAPAPATDTDALLELIDDQAVDVVADTASFAAGAADLTGLDVSQPIDAVFADWKDASDSYVDVYAYSTAVYLGSFPVVGGNVVLTGLDLSGLAPGAHHLLLRGQGSGAVAVVAFTALAADGDPQLAATGAEIAAGSALAAALLLAGGVLLVIRRRARVRLA
jgi:LPXTG-motif cell wall-anchored protein